MRKEEEEAARRAEEEKAEETARRAEEEKAEEARKEADIGKGPPGAPTSSLTPIPTLYLRPCPYIYPYVRVELLFRVVVL